MGQNDEQSDQPAIEDVDQGDEQHSTVKQRMQKHIAEKYDKHPKGFDQQKGCEFLKCTVCCIYKGKKKCIACSRVVYIGKPCSRVILRSILCIYCNAKLNESDDQEGENNDCLVS